MCQMTSTINSERETQISLWRPELPSGGHSPVITKGVTDDPTPSGTEDLARDNEFWCGGAHRNHGELKLHHLS